MPEITVFRSQSELGISLLKWIDENGLAKIEIVDSNEVLNYNINKGVELFEADYYIDMSHHQKNTEGKIKPI